MKFLNGSGLALRLAFSAATVSLIAACGGGGGGDTMAETASAATPPTPATAAPFVPVQPTTRYLANGEGGIGTALLDLDANGMVKVDDALITIKAGGASGCTGTSTPADPDSVVCNLLAEGKAFLFCPNTSSSFFDLAMFRESDFQLASGSELGGLTMVGLSCGPTGVRTLATQKIDFAAGGSPAVQSFGNGSSTWTTNDVLGGFLSTNGARYFDYQRRWVVYKTVAGNRTTYFLMEVAQPLTATTSPWSARIYTANRG